MKTARKVGQKMGRMNAAQKVVQAHRLASADFYYAMDPERTAVICRLTPARANQLRNSEPYRQQMEMLKLEMDQTLRKDMKADAERLKQRMASLVPGAIEKLADQLEDGGVVGLQAAREILDRHGLLPKVSRVQNQIEDKRGLPEPSEDLLEEFGVERPN